MADPAIQALSDRLDITDTLYRYASCIDVKDNDGIRAVLADDLWAKYGNADPVIGGDTVAKWIDEMTRDCVWQHHLLSVYHVDVAGDEADALIYHTSHQLFESWEVMESTLAEYAARNSDRAEARRVLEPFLEVPVPDINEGSEAFFQTHAHFHTAVALLLAGPAGGGITGVMWSVDGGTSPW
jgi:hypothetical protein